MVVSLYACRNIVFLSKGQKGYQDFVQDFLVKYEEVTTIDFYNSTKTKKRFKTVKERRNLYTEDANFIKFSRGILELIPREFYTLSERLDGDTLSVSPLALDDKKVAETTLPAYELRDDQVLAVKKALILKRGVIQLPTATGKSSIITTIIKKLSESNPGKLKALVLAPTLSTVENINKTLVKFGVNSEVFGHPNKDLRSEVTSSLVQSLVTVGEDSPSFLEGVNAVVYDECLPSNSKVLLADGRKESISRIYEDDSINEVLSYSTETRQYEVRKILRKFKTPFDGRFWKLYYIDPLTGKSKGVTATYNHKIWTQFRGYVPLCEVSQGDYIKIDVPSLRGYTSADKLTYVRVSGVSPNVGSKAAYKYNLEIDETHNYFANDVLVSNCHHLKCETWNKLNSLLPNVEYSIGFSALAIDKKEIYLQDIRQLSYTSALITGCSGKVIMHMDPSYYIEKGIIALPVVFRVKNTQSFPKDFDESKWAETVKYGLQSTDRTEKVASTAVMFARRHRKVLILVSERDHSFVIGRFLYQKGLKRFGISFGAGQGFYCDELDQGQYVREDVPYVKEDTLKVIEMLGTGEIDVVIATSHADEGVDINALDACVLACGGKKDRRIVQRIGRVLRKSKTGKYAYVVDFTDDGSRVLSRQSKQRLRMYKNDIGVPKDNIFDGILLEYVEGKLKELEGLE